MVYHYVHKYFFVTAVIMSEESEFANGHSIICAILIVHPDILDSLVVYYSPLPMGTPILISGDRKNPFVPSF